MSFDALYGQAAAALSKLTAGGTMDVQALRDALEPVFAAEGFREMSQGMVARILVIRLDRIGDFVLMRPFLRELRRNFPQARISLLVRPVVAEMARQCPYVNEVLELELAVPQLTRRGLYSALDFAREQLWSRYFDLAFCPRGSESVMVDGSVAYLSGARERIGCSVNTFGVMGARQEQLATANYFLTRSVQLPQKPMQELEHNLLLLRAAGLEVKDNRLESWFGRAQSRQAAALCAGFAPGCRVAAVGIGASEPRKTYPVQLLARALAPLATGRELAFLLLGGPGDHSAGEELLAALPPGTALNLAGKASLPVSEALTARTELYIGNDTGLLHMAAAQHLPVLEISCDLPVAEELSYLRLPVRFAPWQVPYILVRPEKGLDPCDKLQAPIGCMEQKAHCIATIAPERVTQAARKLLEVLDASLAGAGSAGQAK